MKMQLHFHGYPVVRRKPNPNTSEHCMLGFTAFTPTYKPLRDSSELAQRERGFFVRDIHREAIVDTISPINPQERLAVDIRTGVSIHQSKYGTGGASRLL